MQAEADKLTLQVEATNTEDLVRVKDVIGRHLQRFSGDEALTVTWLALS